MTVTCILCIFFTKVKEPEVRGPEAKEQEVRVAKEQEVRVAKEQEVKVAKEQEVRVAKGQEVRVAKAQEAREQNQTNQQTCVSSGPQ